MTPDLPKAPPPGSVLEEALYVEDLDEAAAFYGSVLGLTEITRVPGRHIFYWTCRGHVPPQVLV